MYDFAVIGGGIIGLSTARSILGSYPGAGLVLLEKEKDWAQHQTGHNSGVYYKPGSLKARFSKEGGERLVEFCQEPGIVYEICGKVIVATEPEEMPLLRTLYQRARNNGIEVEKIGPEELNEIEPHAAGIAALKVQSTGIVDFVGTAKAFARRAEAEGGELRIGAEVTGRHLGDWKQGRAANRGREVSGTGSYQMRWAAERPGSRPQRNRFRGEDRTVPR